LFLLGVGGWGGSGWESGEEEGAPSPFMSPPPCLSLSIIHLTSPAAATATVAAAKMAKVENFMVVERGVGGWGKVVWKAVCVGRRERGRRVRVVVDVI